MAYWTADSIREDAEAASGRYRQTVTAVSTRGRVTLSCSLTTAISSAERYPAVTTSTGCGAVAPAVHNLPSAAGRRCAIPRSQRPKPEDVINHLDERRWPASKTLKTVFILGMCQPFAPLPLSARGSSFGGVRLSCPAQGPRPSSGDPLAARPGLWSNQETRQRQSGCTRRGESSPGQVRFAHGLSLQGSRQMSPRVVERHHGTRRLRHQSNWRNAMCDGTSSPCSPSGSNDWHSADASGGASSVVGIAREGMGYCR
jgi:hypothetical protein